MEVFFRQVYIAAGVRFPFTVVFQRYLSGEVSELVEPSAKFIKRCGSDFNLVFNVSAKKGISENEIRGAAVFRKTKDVEYTIFLPFDVISEMPDLVRGALELLLDGVCSVFSKLEINTAKLLERRQMIVDKICADPAMIEPRRV